MSTISFSAPPTVARFMSSEAFMRIILGPVGSGKTTGCIFELLRRCIAQGKAPDGYRYSRWAIVRQTLKQLEDTVLKDIESWLKGLVKYKVSNRTVYIEFGDPASEFGAVRSEWLLIPLDDPEDQRRLLSMQLTGAWLSECIEMDPAVVAPLAGRCGRYPSGNQGVPTWFGMVADTNFPTEGTPWHTLFENPPPDWMVYKQPGGMEPDAENLEWLTQTPETLRMAVDDPRRLAQGRTYYRRLVDSMAPDWVNRYVHARYGTDPSGSAVYGQTFNRRIHVVHGEDGLPAELTPVHGMPLIVGQDFGRNPWSLICQADHRGRLIVLEEVPGEDIGLELHITRNLLPVLRSERYLGIPVALVGDPSGNQRSMITEENSFDVCKRNNLAIFPAPTNLVGPRIQAVDTLLMRLLGGAPALQIDGTRCPKLVLGMNGLYRFVKKRDGTSPATPEKSHPYSDVNDALQYACLAAQGNMINLLARRLQSMRSGRPQRQGPRANRWSGAV